MGIFQRSLQTWGTTLTIVLLAIVFAATHGAAAGRFDDVREASRKLGTVEQLGWVTPASAESDQWWSELKGPLELWDGEWWRIPASNLHHVGFWHLLLNSLFLAIYGRLLELTWGTARYLLFLCGAGLVAILPEYLLENYAIGFSGVCCAIYGALWGLRLRRPEIAAIITPSHVVTMLALLLLMFVATELGLMQIANLGHFTGLLYGRLAVALVGEPDWRGAWLRYSFVLAHLWLIVPYTLVTRPFWNGRYYWYQATLVNLKLPDAAERETAWLRRAVDVDPSLGVVWLTLANRELARGEKLAAWNDLLHGLSHQPAHAELFTTAQRLWRRLAVSPDREAALACLRQCFGSASDSWLDQLRRLPEPPILISPREPVRPREPLHESIVERPRWAGPPDPEWWRTSTPRLRSLPVDDPRTAGEGELL